MGAFDVESQTDAHSVCLTWEIYSVIWKERLMYACEMGMYLAGPR